MTHRRIGEAGLNLIKTWEGLSLTAYRDTAGVWTIGYGHTGTVDRQKITSGMKITEAKAAALLSSDCQVFADAVDDKANVPVTEKLNANQRDALISFAFNCGAASLKRLCKGRNIAQIGSISRLTSMIFPGTV